MGEFIKSRHRNPMKPKLVDCDINEDVCLSLYGKTDWKHLNKLFLKHCFKRSDLPEVSDGCIELGVRNINTCFMF